MLAVITKSDGIEWIRERKLSDSGWDETVKAIASGEWTDIHEVRRLATGEVVTRLIAEEVAVIWHEDGERLEDWQQSFLDDNLRRRKLPPSNVRPRPDIVVMGLRQAAE